MLIGLSHYKVVRTNCNFPTSHISVGSPVIPFFVLQLPQNRTGLVCPPAIASLSLSLSLSRYLPLSPASGFQVSTMVSCEEKNSFGIVDDVKKAAETVVVREKNKNQKLNDDEIMWPPSQFPQPVAPAGLHKKSNKFHGQRKIISRSLSHESSTAAAFNDVTLLGKYIKERGSAMMMRISSVNDRGSSTKATEIDIPDMKVIVRKKIPEVKAEKLDIEFEGQISFFSRSNCRDCGALRSFFREKGLKYVEINLDVFPNRAKELKERTGSCYVPQIFLNEKLLGGLVVVNSLRNSGELEKRLKDIAGVKCPETAPKAPIYGHDDDNPQTKDSMLPIISFLRTRIPLQDRFIKMKRVKNCFSGADLVETVVRQLKCDRSKAVEIGKELENKHFIHHIFRENVVFEDGNQHYYQLLEHDLFIPKIYNFKGSTNDNEPKSAVIVGQQLTKLMIAIVEAYASDDRRNLDYHRIGMSEEFRRYGNMVQDLQRVDVFSMSTDENLAFFLNLYNAMFIHAILKLGRPEGLIGRRKFNNDFCYIIGGYHFSLSIIKNGILRSNRKPTPYSFAKPIGPSDNRLRLTHSKHNPLIHFGLFNGSPSTPPIRFFSAQGIEVELRQAAREFFQAGGIHIDLEKRTVFLTKIINWYSVDFGRDREILNWILNFLNPTKAGLLTHLLSDASPVNIIYQD